MDVDKFRWRQLVWTTLIEYLASDVKIEGLILPEGHEEAEGEERHEQVADGEDVCGHRERHVRLQDHPQLHREGDAVQEGGDDPDHDGAGEEGAAQTGPHERHPR